MKLSFLSREEVTPEEQVRRHELKAATRRQRDAEKEHEKGIKDAAKALKQAQKEYDRAVMAAENALAAARANKKLASLRGVRVYDDRIETPEGTAQLSAAVRADVDTAGGLQHSSRVTVTRLATMGVFALAFKKKKIHDSRELYLVIETPDFMSIQNLDANLGPHARALVATINTAVKQAERLRASRASAIASAQDSLNRVRADRSGVEAAERALAKVTADTAEIERCRAEVVALESK